jgi:hypothetical protein
MERLSDSHEQPGGVESLFRCLSLLSVAHAIMTKAVAQLSNVTGAHFFVRSLHSRQTQASSGILCLIPRNRA